MKSLLSIGVLSLLLVAFVPQIYKSASFATALNKHKTVAILPADVTMQLRPNQMKNTTPEQLAEMNSKTGHDVQEKMYGWFLRKGDKYKYTVTFQDVTKTNAMLKKAGIRYADLKDTDRPALAKLLGVDAVLQNKLVMEKPMSEGAAVAVGLLVGAWGSTNKVQTTINIHDGASGDMLWKYDYAASGSVGSSTTNLVDALMRNAAKKFPYSSR